MVLEVADIQERDIHERVVSVQAPQGHQSKTYLASLWR
jgi:hypothetical protein